MAVSKGDKAPGFETEDQKGNMVRVPSGRKTALMFMRYLGCPLCLHKMDEVKAKMDEFNAAGADVMVVVQSTSSRVKSFSDQKGVPFLLISDREKKFYQLYDVKAGGLGAMLSPNVLKETVKATFKGKMHGAFEGDEFQIPASFVVGTDGKVHFAYYGRDVADFGDVAELIAAVKSAP